ncbi:MAG: hypothetical protein LBQ00_06715 [Syntrophobacterales bacterium]|jgi:hypothetical protein|nr:hypothetical protein [Syntrophobacterales bacterium]
MGGVSVTIEVEVYKNCTMIYLRDDNGHLIECYETRDITIRDYRRFKKIGTKTTRGTLKAVRGN